MTSFGTAPIENIPCKGQLVAEIHVFLGPINPDHVEVARYRQAVEDFNAQNPGIAAQAAMKDPLLCLVLSNGQQITVAQSARHIFTNDPAEMLMNAHYDRHWFEERKFEILRVKIECCSGNLVLGDDEQPRAWSTGGYFEAHLRVHSGKGKQVPLEDAEIASLNNISNRLGKQFDWPVPLSFNRTRHPSGIYQRYLNVRHRNFGQFKRNVTQVAEMLREHGLTIDNQICELVLADTNRALDNGWLEFPV